MNVSDTISLLNAQLQERVINEILLTRYQITDGLRCIHFFHFVHDYMLFHQSNAYVSIEVTHEIHEYHFQLQFRQPFVHVYSRDVLSPFLS